MKKISFKLSAVLLLTLYAVSCAKEPDLGTVSLDPSSKTVTFGQVFNIKPVFSATGEAKNKTYTWKSSADSIASIKMVSGGFGEVTPKRIGQATMTYASTDGKITNSHYYGRSAVHNSEWNLLQKWRYTKRDQQQHAVRI